MLNWSDMKYKKKNNLKFCKRVIFKLNEIKWDIKINISKLWK